MTVLAKAPVVEPEEIDDEDSPEERKKRHAFLILWFQFLFEETQYRLGHIAEKLVVREIDTRTWAATFQKEMAQAHAEAWTIGRRLAGDAAAINAGDIAAGKDAWSDQEAFFKRFRRDIEDGRYTDEQGNLKLKPIAARSQSYAKALKGTARESFRQAMGKESLAWILGVADHCKPETGFRFTCEELADEPPKPADEWETAPGLGDTPCVNECKCHFESSDGKYSTQGI